MTYLISHIVAAHARVADNPSLDEDDEVQQAVVVWLQEALPECSSPPERDLLEGLIAAAASTGDLAPETTPTLRNVD